MSDPARWHLAVRDTRVEGPAHQLCLEAGPVVIGRSRRVQVRLPDEAISGAHARLQRRDGQVYVEDLGSMNGTRVGGQAITPRTEHPLQPGDWVEIGAYRVGLTDEPAAEALIGEEGTNTLATRLVREILDAGHDTRGQARLCIRHPGGGELTIPLVAGRRLVLGRDPDCDLALADDELSRRHVAFVVDERHVTVEDLGSKNGVLVNGERVADRRRLGDRDRLRFGACVADFDDPAAQFLAALDRQSPALTPLPWVPTTDPGAPDAAAQVGFAGGSAPRSPWLWRGLAVGGIAIVIAAIWALWGLFG